MKGGKQFAKFLTKGFPEMDHATSLIEMFIPNGCCLPNGSLKIYFVLEAEEDFLPILPTIGDARLGCTTLVSQESASLFGRFKLCGGLDLSSKMVGMHKDFWSIVAASHLL